MSEDVPMRPCTSLWREVRPASPACRQAGRGGWRPLAGGLEATITPTLKHRLVEAGNLGGEQPAEEVGVGEHHCGREASARQSGRHLHADVAPANEHRLCREDSKAL